MNGSRWKVVTVEGYALHASRNSGLTVSILDRKVNHRTVASFRSEEERDVIAAAKRRLAELRAIEP